MNLRAHEDLVLSPFEAVRAVKYQCYGKKIFYLTGKFNRPRTELYNILKEYYHITCSNRLTKNIHHLVVGEEASQDKILYAKAIGINILTKESFNGFFNNI